MPKYFSEFHMCGVIMTKCIHTKINGGKLVDCYIYVVINITCMSTNWWHSSVYCVHVHVVLHVS